MKFNIQQTVVARHSEKLIKILLWALIFALLLTVFGKKLFPTAPFPLDYSNDQWLQNYLPINGNLLVSSLVAIVPIIVMTTMLTFKIPAYIASILSLTSTLLLAINVWKMPVNLAISSTLLGMAVAIFPILWTLVNSVWIFNMLTENGYFDIIKKSLGYISSDRRIQTILIGFGFTSLLESIAAFGAPIAIVSAILIGFGFPPMLAAVVALLADTSSSAWGTQSMPIIVLNSVTKLDIHTLSKVIGQQLSFASMLLPAGLVIVVSGWKGFKEVWQLTLVVGLSYSVMAIITAYFISPYIVGITGAMAAILTTLIILRYWHPKQVWRFPGDANYMMKIDAGTKIPFDTILRAWSPYILLVLVISLVNSTGLKDWLSSFSTFKLEWPGLHNAVLKTAPVVSSPEPYSAIYSQPVLLVGGSLVFFTGILTALILKIPFSKAFQTYGSTIKKLSLPGLTIISILGIAYLMNYSAMTYTIGLAFAATGFWFPLATVFLGMIGCTLAGSVAASNALFGNLAVVAGNQIGVTPLLSAATLASGGTIGKAIAFQNLVIATATLNMAGKEGNLLFRVLGVSIMYGLIIGLVAMLQQYLFPWLIP